MHARSAHKRASRSASARRQALKFSLSFSASNLDRLSTGLGRLGTPFRSGRESRCRIHCGRPISLPLGAPRRPEATLVRAAEGNAVRLASLWRRPGPDRHHGALFLSRRKGDHLARSRRVHRVPSAVPTRRLPPTLASHRGLLYYGPGHIVTISATSGTTTSRLRRSAL